MGNKHTNFTDDIFLQNFFRDLQRFYSQVISELHSNGFQEESRSIDHVCYRVPNLERYEFMKAKLGTAGKLLSEAMVNGRPIATFKLFKPIEWEEYSIDVIEVPSPKPGKFYAEGFEHAEAVVKDSLENFMTRFKEMVFDTRNIHAKINRDISLQLKSGLVKFHESSLEQIIALEEKEFLTSQLA